MWSSIWTERTPRALALGLAAALAASAAPVRAGELHFGSSTARAAVPMQTLRSLRFGATVRQARDFSCGAAAVATLLTYHLGARTSEDEVFDAMWRTGDHALILQQGFSLLDLKGFLTERGYTANGYRLSLDQLREAGVPALALLSSGGFRHFVVVKGLDETRVVVGDPALGTRIVPRAEFEAMRDEILLVALPRAGAGRPEFNSARDWRGRPPAPLASARRGADALSRLMRPGYNEF
jgi:predicted double-glycine peptidase